MESDNSYPKNYVFEVMGEWLAERVRSNYTDEDKKTLIDLAMDAANEVFHDEDDPKEWSALEKILEQDFSIENQIIQARSFFHTTYNQIIEFLKIGLNEVIPEEFKQEYIDPLVQTFQRFTRFVESVGKKYDKKFPEPLSFRDIDKCFVDIFQNTQNFVRFQEELTRYSLQALQVINTTDEESARYKKYYQRFLEMAGPSMLSITRRYYSEFDVSAN